MASLSSIIQANQQPVDSKKFIITPPSDAVAPVIDLKTDSGHLDAESLLVISDTTLPDFKLTSLENLVEFKPELFQNRTLADVHNRCKFLWLNVSQSACRVWLSKNLADCPYTVLLCYTNKSQQWVKDIKAFLPSAVEMSFKKLKRLDGLDTADLVDGIISKVISIAKPTSALARLFGCGTSKNV